MNNQPGSETQPKRSSVEIIKENSRQLRGTIAEELAKDTDHFSEQDKQLLKFHGSYQQDDRDARKDRHRDKAGKLYISWSLQDSGRRRYGRAIPRHGRPRRKHANGTLRITSRQGFQLHGVIKSDLKGTIADINRCLLSTFAACGDVPRNVMAPAAPFAAPVYCQMQDSARAVAADLAPRTRAYHEIWLNGEAVTKEPEVPEPIYGKVYLPRKFKVGFALPEDNSVDVYAQDLGFLAIVENGQIVGYNVLIGGGMGRTHGNEETFPHLAQPIASFPRIRWCPRRKRSSSSFAITATVVTASGPASSTSCTIGASRSSVKSWPSTCRFRWCCRVRSR